MVLAALPAVGAGSAKQAVRQDSDPSITIYNQGVELMLAKRFPQAQAKFEQAATLQKVNPQLAKELAEVIKTGKEEDRFYGLSSKLRG